jgi:predicted secreted protein
MSAVLQHRAGGRSNVLIGFSTLSFSSAQGMRHAPLRSQTPPIASESAAFVFMTATSAQAAEKIDLIIDTDPVPTTWSPCCSPWLRRMN